MQRFFAPMELGGGPELNPRVAFAAALAEWLHGMKFNVGLTLQEVDTAKELAAYRKAGKFVAAVTGDMFALVQSYATLQGADRDQLFNALIPFRPLADLVASRVKFGNVIVPLVIFADDLEPPILMERFKQFVASGEPLKKLLPKIMFFVTAGVVWLYPLLVYFDPGKHVAARNSLLPFGWQFSRTLYTRTALRVGFVSVSKGTVTWAEGPGLRMKIELAIDKSFDKLVGTDTDPDFSFDASDLANVKILADRRG